MIKTGIKEARQNLPDILNKVRHGEEVIITKRGDPIAKVIPLQKKPEGALSGHKILREALAAKGKPLSGVIAEARRGERL
jgi:prevent-host-death family protein